MFVLSRRSLTEANILQKKIVWLSQKFNFSRGIFFLFCNMGKNPMANFSKNDYEILSFFFHNSEIIFQNLDFPVGNIAIWDFSKPRLAVAGILLTTDAKSCRKQLTWVTPIPSKSPSMLEKVKVI